MACFRQKTLKIVKLSRLTYILTIAITDYIFLSYGSAINENQQDLTATNTSDTETNSVHVQNISYKNTFQKWTEENLSHSIPYTLALVFGYLIVFVVGITGNILVVVVNILKREIRSVKNLFIFNLAIADLLLLFLCVVPTLLANILNSWVMGSFMCSAVTYVQGVSVFASAYSIVALSFDRCKAIAQTSLSRAGFSKSQALVSVCLIWFFALILPIPCAMVFRIDKFEEDGNTYCHEVWSNKVVGQVYFLLANLFCCYLLPLILISVANLVIWWKVSNRPMPAQESFILHSNMSQLKEMHTRTKRGVGKLLGTVTLTFLLSWLPLYCIAVRVVLLVSFKPLEVNETTILAQMVPLAQWLAYWNSCINPLFYAFFNARFRKLFKNAVPGWVKHVCCRHAERGETTG